MTVLVGFEAAGARGGYYWLKQFPRDAASAEYEFSVLEEIHRRMADQSQPGAVPALAIWPEHGAFISAHVEGAAVSSLRDAREASAARCAQWAGCWLAQLQNAGPVRSDPYDFRALAEKIGVEFPTVSVRLQRRLDELADEASESEVDLVLTHGDFGPHNLLHAGDRLVAFDPAFPVLRGTAPWSSAAEDLARYSSWWLSGPAAALTDVQRRAHVTELLAAYRAAGGAAVTFRSASFRLFLTYFLLCNLRDWRSRWRRWSRIGGDASSLRAWEWELCS